MFKMIDKYLYLLETGGILYYVIELLWRGHSHYAMAIVGGIAFVLVGLINEFVLTYSMPLWIQMLISSGTITTLEFVSGMILNLWLRLNIWDYSNLPFNFMGQICLSFSVAWFFLSLVAILLDDWMRYLFFGEERPHYQIF